MRLSTFAHVCLHLLAFSPLRSLAFGCVCPRLSAFACVCSHLLTPPLLRPPLRDTSQLSLGTVHETVSMTGSERPSLEPLLTKEASPTVLGGVLRILGNSRQSSESVAGFSFRNFHWKVPAALGICQEPLNTPFLIELFSRGFSRGKTAH